MSRPVTYAVKLIEIKSFPKLFGAHAVEHAILWKMSGSDSERDFSPQKTSPESCFSEITPKSKSSERLYCLQSDPIGISYKGRAGCNNVSYLYSSPEAKREKTDQEEVIDITDSLEDLVVATPEWSPVYCSRALQTEEVLNLFANPARINSQRPSCSLFEILMLFWFRCSFSCAAVFPVFVQGKVNGHLFWTWAPLTQKISAMTGHKKGIRDKKAKRNIGQLLAW